MITNERQYTIVKKRIADLQSEMAQLDENHRGLTGSDLELARIELASTAGNVARFEEGVAEYEQLRSSPVRVENIAGLPTALIRGRIAKGWNQRQLAELLGLKAQQIQRYEATEYASASMKRVMDIASILDLDWGTNSSQVTPVSAADIFQPLESLRMSREFILERVLSPRVADGLELGHDEGDALGAARAVTEVERVLGLESLSEAPASARAVESGIRFKIPRTTNLGAILPYVGYTRFVMGQAVAATRTLARVPIPQDPQLVRDEIHERGGMSFESALEYVWAHGIPVIPLSDAGRFHGAWLRVDEQRDAIVVKQRTSLSSRWLFDLMHELHHAQTGQTSDVTEIFEFAAINSTDDPSEIDANQFATSVILGGDINALQAEVLRRADGRIGSLKDAVQTVAESEKVPAGALANHMAHALSGDGIDWWGAAHNLQGAGNPRAHAQEVALRNLSADDLDEHGRHVLLAAVTAEN